MERKTGGKGAVKRKQEPAFSCSAADALPMDKSIASVLSGTSFRQKLGDPSEGSFRGRLGYETRGM